MSERNTVMRAMHDLGGAAWFGGSLMGAVGLNGAASDVADPADRARVAAAGWARWAPVNAAAIGVHAVGGFGLILANRSRVAKQSGVGANTTVKTALTVLAAGATAYSGMLGKEGGAGWSNPRRSGHHAFHPDPAGGGQRAETTTGRAMGDPRLDRHHYGARVAAG